MLRLDCLVAGLLAFACAAVSAEEMVVDCPELFPGGLQSYSNDPSASRGNIDFDYNAQVLGNLDTVLHAKAVSSNAGSTLFSCESAHCQADPTAPVPRLKAGIFPDMQSYKATMAVGYQESTTLSGNGSNQYKSITLGDQGQLTIDSGGQSFYIDELVLESNSVLRLAPGEYWIRSFRNGYQSQIQVNGTKQVRLFVEDDLSFESSSLINSPAINSPGTSDLLLVYGYGKITLNNLTTLSGFVYSAYSQGSHEGILMNSPSYVFGGMTAENIALEASAQVNYVVPGDRCGSGTEQIDHFDFSYSSAALTCEPQPIRIRACLDSACESLYSGTASITMSPARYWGARAPAGVSGSTIIFTGGSVLAWLRTPTAGSVELVVEGSQPSTSSTPVCSSSDCLIDYADSGLLLEVPDLLAAKPAEASVSAVRKSDDALHCVPAFASVTRNVRFEASYLDPASGSRQLQINDSLIEAGGSSVELDFDAHGHAPLQVRYEDAGLIGIAASYVGNANNNDIGLRLNGEDQFISKPFGLCLQADFSCASADASCAVVPGVRAGDEFPVRISAVAWERDAEPAIAEHLCQGNVPTPNFKLANIPLASAVLAPVGGEPGTVTPASYSHALGERSTLDVALSEVGVFRLSATPEVASYFGLTVGGGSSEPLGRFIPAYLAATGGASLTPSCGSLYSYQGQWMSFAEGREPSLTVAGHNRAGELTRNYDRPGFWKLNPPSGGGYVSLTGSEALDIRLERRGSDTPLVSSVDDGDGARTYRWSDAQLRYLPPEGIPSVDDYPFQASIQQGFSAEDMTDADNVCYGNGSGCQEFSYPFSDDPGSEVRLGRLRIGSALGSELQSLKLDVSVESWQSAAYGGGFRQEGMDNCTELGAPTLDRYTDNLESGETLPSLSVFAAGIANLTLSAPGTGNNGSVQISFPTSPDWLEYPWDGASRRQARGMASFGIYAGEDALIYRRELLR